MDDFKRQFGSLFCCGRCYKRARHKPGFRTFIHREARARLKRLTRARIDEAQN